MVIAKNQQESPINIKTNEGYFCEDFLRNPIEFYYQKTDSCEKMFNIGHTFQIDCNGRDNS
jgi:hypothetical protein